METTKEIQERADKLQNECHDVAETMVDVSTMPITYQDATNVWLFHKLAEIELAHEAEINRKNAVLLRMTEVMGEMANECVRMSKAVDELKIVTETDK